MKTNGMTIRTAFRTGLLGILLCLSYASSAEKPPQMLNPERDTLRIQGSERSFQPKLDPAKGEMVFVGQQIFDGLVRLDDNLNIVPDLADYWNISEGGRCYTFYLRKGVRFHDGRALTAADVKFSLERLLRKDTESPYGQLFIDKVLGAEDFAKGKTAGVSGFRVLDPSIFELEWKYPFFSALNLLGMSFCRILPKDLVERQGQDFFFHPIGTGPFQFDYWLRGAQLDILGVRLLRNSAYHGRKPRISAVEYSPFFTSDQFAEREVDIAPFSNNLTRLGCQVVEGGAFDISFLMMSCANPPLDRTRVRRAMSLLINKDKFVETFSVEAVNIRASHTFIPAKLPGFFPSIDPGNPDPERARQILEEEGYFLTKMFPEILFFMPAAKRTSDALFVREIVRQFAAVGVVLVPRYFRRYDELKDVTQPFLAYLEWAMDYPDPENVIQPLFSKPAPANGFISRFSNPEFERLFVSAVLESGRTKRLDLFREMEQILRREVPAIPLFSFEPRLAVQPFVRGLRIPALGAMYIDLREVTFVR
jgi:ABC-type transport system substrate-binding protein